ncbi:MAG: tyrosine-protein phosphatase [Microscillaceae bacterium]|nr:tyrosine-protein phosphatase [Microscillaceae bacterium]
MIIFLTLLLITVTDWFAYQFYFKNIAVAGPEYAPQEDILVKRHKSGNYLIVLNPQLSTQVEGVFTDLSFEKKPSENNAMIQIQDYQSLIKPINPHKRQVFYFHLVQSQPRVVSERLIYLDGACNSRDLGGYRNQEGRFVKWGCIFRSDKLSSLSKNDFYYLQNLNIRLICDFRGPEESTAHPNKFPDFFQPKLLKLPIYDPRRSLKDLLKTLRKADPSSFSGEAYMLDGYQMFTRQFAGYYKQLFDALLDDSPGSVLFHCTGGKDRTGLASALILYALDVPWETIYQDYMASNYYRWSENKRHIRLGRLYGINPKVLTPILEVRKVYLDTAFDTIRAQHGSIDHFMQYELGLGKEQKEILRAKYLY